MNLVSSKLGRAKLASRVSETVTVYSIQLYIQSLRVAHRGYVYFVWMSDTTQIQSLRYQSGGKNVQVKETLTISERVAVRNSKEQTVNTFLKLMTEDGEELDECEIPINSLAPQYREMEVPMNRGLVLLKARRKIMNPSSEQQLGSPNSYRRRAKLEEAAIEGTGLEVQSMQQELGRVKKELQDEVYLNNKLKNDREVLLVTKQELKSEIEGMREEVGKEIANLRGHYEGRISIREQCYEEEIEDIVNVFNSSAQQSRKVVEMVLKQKLKLEEEWRQLQDRLRKNEVEQTSSAESNRRLENEKSEIAQHLREAEDTILQKDQRIEGLSGQNSSIRHETEDLRAHISDLQSEILRNEARMGDQENVVGSLQQKLHEVEFELNSKQMCIREFELNLQLLREKEEEWRREREGMVKERGLLENERRGHCEEIESLKARLEELEYEMEFNENVTSQLKKQHAQKEDELYGQLESLEELYSKKIQDMLLGFQAERQQIESGHEGLQLEKEGLQRRLADMEGTIRTTQTQLSDLGREIETISVQLQAKSKANDEKDQLIASLESEVNNVKDESKQFQAEVQRLAQQLQQTNVLIKQGGNSLVERYQQDLQSKDEELKRLSEQVATSEKQIKVLRQQREQFEQQRIADANKVKARRSVSGMKLEDLQGLLPAEVSEVVAHKQHEIVELKARVGELQNVYHHLRTKIHEIADKHPEIDIESFGVQVEQLSELDEDHQFNLQLVTSTFRPVNQNQTPPRHPSSRQSDKKDMIPSGRQSVASGLKVSVKRVPELEEQVRDLLQKEKTYKSQIEQYEGNLNILQTEVNFAKQSLIQYTKEAERSMQNKESHVLVEDARVIALSQENYSKEVEIEKSNYRIKELQAALNRERGEIEKKVSVYQKASDEFVKREGEYQRKAEGLNETLRQLQRELSQLQQKLRKQKQGAQQARLSIKELVMHRENDQSELKKLRNLNEVLQDKLQKLSGSEGVMRELSREVSELEKKMLEQTRAMNHLKLEKDAVEEQLRMLKKRQNDHVRIAMEWEEKAAALERGMEETRRKENKLKREIDQGQEDVRRSKLQIKKLEEELQAMGTAQISWQVERRKHLDEISSLQDQLSRKDYELTKLSKQIQKWRLKFDEKDEVRMGRKSEMREEIDRLQGELIRRQKKILQESEQNKLLRGRLQLLQRENKRIMQQKNQTYGEKLKYYVEEMGSIKKLLEEYQTDNNRLKVENNELYEDGEIARVNLDKMEAKYDECMEREENLLNDLQSYMAEVNMLKDRLAQANAQLDQIEAAYAALRKEADEEKLNAKRLAEKVEIGERNLQRAMSEVRELKVRLSDSETSQQITGKIDEKYRQVNRRKQELQEQCKRLKTEHDNLLATFIYKREDLEKAVGDVRTQQKRLREEQVQGMREQCSKTVISKTQRLEQEILEVYNESTKLRAEMQGLHEENSRQKARICDLENTLDRMGPIQSECENAKNVSEQLRVELRKRADQLGKLQIAVERGEGECKMKQRELSALRSRLQLLERANQKLGEEVKLRRTAERELQESVQRLSVNKTQQKEEQQQVYKQREVRLVEQYEARIGSLEGELRKTKQKEIQTSEENAGKMRKLQGKMDEMEAALKERQIAIQTHYEDQMAELQDSLMKLSQQLEEKLMRIEELTNSIIALETENKNLNHDIEELHYSHEDEKRVHDDELAKVKNKIKEIEAAHASNLKSLEEEYRSQGSQGKGANVTTSRMKSGDLQDRIAKRYEQKMKMKDRRIDELKQNIYTLEETIVKLRKKENGYESTLLEIERIKISFAQLQRQQREAQVRHENEANRNVQLITQLKRQSLLLKESEQKCRLTLQQKNLQHESMDSELRTLRELYQQLQRELQKRKLILTSQMQQENSLQGQFKIKENRVLELEEQIVEKNGVVRELEQQNKRKTGEIRKYAEALEEYRANEEKYRNEMARVVAELNASRKTGQELSVSYESTKGQLRQTKNELGRLKKNQEDIKTNSLNREQVASELKKLNEELSLRLRESQQAARRYVMLNERSRKQLGFSIEQIIDRFIVVQEQRQQQLNQLFEQIEQLKFLNERKFLDFDELKKENLEMQIKVQDLDILSEQVDTLRKICDKLQEEKKNTVFREEVLRMQMENLAATGSAELRARIEYILANPPVPSYGSFSFYEK